MWIVVLLIFGGIVFLCFGGFTGLVFISNQKTSESADPTPTPKPTPSTSGKDDSPPSDRKAETKLDISEWGRKSTEFGKTEFVDGELLMSANRKGYFYVLIAKQGDGRTNKANTSVIVRNIDSEPTNVGYGLVIHSSPTPLDKDYSFLIDTVKQRYRIAYHIAKKESILVDWTQSVAVKSGAAENVLEARDLDNKIEFYINGTMVTSIRNVHGHPNGVPGIYSGDGLKIGFKDLTLRR